MTIEEAHTFLDNLMVCIEEHPIVADWLVEIADRKTENCSEIPNNCEAKNYCDDCLYTDTCDSKEFFYACTSKATISKMEQVEDEFKQFDREDLILLIECQKERIAELLAKDEPQTERIKTLDYCDICNHKGCDNCIANNLDDYCVPSGYEPITKTETQNSNLTFEKRTMWDCYNCKRYETEGECIECHYEPKTEPQTDCGDFADRLAYERGVKHAWEVAQKVFDSTVTFYEAEDVAKQIDKLQTERSE